MGLAQYRRRRSFRRTPEPPPGRPTKTAGPVFVVQKHAASHLHYDFRLEYGGVLKSWAVPKGPSMDPRDKRLAIQVEDHPLAYKDFEGRIPKGEYGAGLVEKWDEGTYSLNETDGAPEAKGFEAGLQKGHLDFTLKGRKLKGSFALVRLKNRDKDNQWLLIKRKDDPPVGPSRSAPARQQTEKDLDFQGAVQGPMPQDARPMLATLVDGPFDRKGWAFEVKWDGYRALAEIRKGRVRLLSRQGLSLTDTFPTVASALGGFPLDVVLDGEIVAVDAAGRPDFQKLQDARRSASGPILYYVFDILYAGRYDLRPLPLRRRKAILQKLLPVSPTVRLSEAVEEKGTALFKAVEKQGLEGLVAKDLDSPYRSGSRTRDWLKIKTELRQEAVICGFTEPRASRPYFGALILGVYKNGKLDYIGSVGTGFDQRTLKDIYRKLESLVVRHAPFSGPAPRLKATWVSPRLICEVKFREWTSDGRLRQPVFLGLREDKSPREVRREHTESAAGAAAPRQEIKTRASLTHLDKVFWPKEGITKRDVIEYYSTVADWMLPYLEGRPQSLNRHPDGITGESFFQKNVTQAPPPWVETVKIPSEDRGRMSRHIVCNNRDTLIYLANLGCIEINVWNSITRRLDSPDYAVLDFDPLETSFQAVVEAVLAAKRFLDELGLPAFCKTSGATGMHVYIPLAPRFSHEQARELAQLVCLVVNGRHPDLTSLERSPGKRQGRVYLDYLQNRRGATMAAPYAIRPHEGAPVSTPLAWDEVGPGLDPLDFTVRTVPERLAAKGDSWKGLFKQRVDIVDALARFEKWRKKRTSSHQKDHG